MPTSRWRRARAVAATLACLVSLAACSTAVDGVGTTAPLDLRVQGDSGSAFDLQVKTSLADVIGFWVTAYPTIAHGKPLPMLKGSLYSVDGDAVVRTKQAAEATKGNECLRRQLAFIIDNAAYCRLDDSIIWDRGPDHLVPVLARQYGPALTALVFAHEFGHAIQQRLGIHQGARSEIDLESQADCAAGAFAAAALAGRTADVTMTFADLDRALVGLFQVRDSTPESSADISHGNGFDRLSAVQEGIKGGATVCFSPTYLHDRRYTERPYTDDRDYTTGGNLPLREILAPTSSLVTDLNRYWKTAARGVGKTFTPVSLKQADHPACGAADAFSEFGYCPDDNTVYYSDGFARRAYNSMTVPDIDRNTAAVRLLTDQPGDFALGALIAIGWGMAARTQLTSKPIDDQAGLVAAICFTGAYAKDINRASPDTTHPFILSPPDMDEASAAVLDLVPLAAAFGARDTTGLQRVQTFVKGYHGDLTSC